MELFQQERLSGIAQQGSRTTMTENFVENNLFQILLRLDVFAHNVGIPIVECAMNFIVRNASLRRLFSYCYGKLFGIRYGNYPCVTCLIMDEGETVKSGLNNPFANRRQTGSAALSKKE